jgi:hypothetical protein
VSNRLLNNAVRHIVELLVNGKYEELEVLSGGNRLKAKDFHEALIDYGATLEMPPDSEYEKIDAIKIENSTPQRWSVRFALWTREEGRSDLSLEMTIIQNGDGSVSYEIDDLHVL